MKRPAKSYKAFPAAGFLVLLVLGFAGQAFADKKPKFLYVANEDFDNISAYTVDSTTGALTPVPGSPFAAAGNTPTAVAVDPSGKFVYVTTRCLSNVSCLNGTVSAYTIDSTTGALAPVPGSPLAAGTLPKSVAVDPSGKFAYVVNECLNSPFPCVENGAVSAYTINRTTGALTPVPGSPFAAGALTFSVAVDPSGKFAYVVNVCLNLSLGCVAPGSVSAYTIDSTTGALSPVLGSPFAANSVPDSVAVDPSGKFAYVANYCGNGFCSNGAVSAFTINSTTGALTPVPGSPYAAGTAPNTVAVDPSGKFVYVANECAVDFCSSGIGSVSAYAINSASGALSPVPGSPFAAGVRPKSLAIAGQSTVPFETFKVKADFDEDRKTSFRVGGFFTLGKTSDGIDPVSETVELQVGTFSATIPAGSFRERGSHEFKFEGRINDVDLKIAIYHIERKEEFERKGRGNRKDRDEGKDRIGGNEFLFTVVGKGNIPTKIVNPVAVGLAIGDDEGSTLVKADIDR